MSKPVNWNSSSHTIYCTPEACWTWNFHICWWFQLVVSLTKRHGSWKFPARIQFHNLRFNARGQYGIGGLSKVHHLPGETNPLRFPMVSKREKQNPQTWMTWTMKYCMVNRDPNNWAVSSPITAWLATLMAQKPPWITWGKMMNSGWLWTLMWLCGYGTNA